MARNLLPYRNRSPRRPGAAGEVWRLEDRNLMNSKATKTGGGSGSTGKVVLALVLFGTAAVYGVHRYSQLSPPLHPEPPKAAQADRVYQKAIQSTYHRKLKELKLTPEQRKQLNHWLKQRLPRNATKEQRRARAERLRKILPPDQLREFQAIRKEYADNLKTLHEERVQRVKTMLGQADYAKHKEDMKKLRAEQKARKPKKPTPVPSPAPGPAT